MDYTNDEIADGRRDMMALIRTHFNHDMAGCDAILSNAGERGTRAIAEGLTGLINEVLPRLTMATGLIEDSGKRGLVLGMDSDDITAIPGMRELIEQNIANIQAGFLGG